MTRPTAGLVIVGAGESGAWASVALREQGYQGSVTLIGAERHAHCERPPVSKSALTDSEARPTTIVDHGRLKKTEIECMSAAQAVAIDRIARSVRLAVAVTHALIDHRRRFSATAYRVSSLGAENDSLPQRF